MLISLLLIPDPISSLWVCLSIVSIELGVVGLIALWGVNLNAVSMINLIMCIGFSVDFSAHISYAYLSASGTHKEKVELALFTVGLPILLGGLSTIVGILPICLADTEVFLIFFRVVFTVVILAMLHALVFLPVFMSALDNVKCCFSGSKNNSTMPLESSRTTDGRKTDDCDSIETASELINDESHKDENKASNHNYPSEFRAQTPIALTVKKSELPTEKNTSSESDDIDLEQIEDKTTKL